jgi:hypothetical protein
MRALRIIRNLVFVLLVCTVIGGMQTSVLALGSHFTSFCNAWGGLHPCSCSDEGGWGYPPSWWGIGSCDFSGEEDPQEVGAAYCYDEWIACSADCEGEYPDFLADWYASNWSQQDPCYEVLSDRGCWWTWAEGGCTAGPTSTFTCSCSSWMICECDEGR